MNIDFSSFNNQKMPTSALTEKRVMETDQDINTQSQVSHYYEGGKGGEMPGLNVMKWQWWIIVGE